MGPLRMTYNIVTKVKCNVLFCFRSFDGACEGKSEMSLQYTDCYFTPHISFPASFLVYFLVKAAMPHE